MATRKTGNYGTHTVPLAISALRTTGPVLELSCGHYSTPLLHALCAPGGRQLRTADHNLTWMDRFRYLETDGHAFEHVPLKSRNQYVYEILYRVSVRHRRTVDWNWDRVGTGVKWGLVFVDHLPGARRVKDVQRLRESTNVFVIHNTDRNNNFVFGFWPYLMTFQFVYEFPVAPGTVVCSDHTDVVRFFE